MIRTSHFVLCAYISCASLAAQVAPTVLDGKIHHLGDTRVKSWPAGDPDPEGLELRITFTATASAEHVLVIRHYQVDNVWPIRINGKVIGRLEKGQVLKDHVYVIPAGRLKSGTNELLIKSNSPADDILVGDIRLFAQTERKYLKLRKVRFSVRGSDGKALPAKITVTDSLGEDLVEIHHGKGLQRAVRQGVVYTSEGDAVFELSEGKYRVYASRGMEWGVDEKRIEVAAGPLAHHQLMISREVDTAGFVSSDAHIHTLTFSGHGDSSVEERMVTLAGEGVELAISTDHNHNTDFGPYQKRMKLTDHFTSVVGNEVTTKNGHFNAFPMNPKDKIPDYKLEDWVKIVDGIRSKGAKVVILNHPRWPQVLTTSPFGKQHFELNRISGRRARGPEFTFDAMELVNSCAALRDPLFLFVDWFALLNHGEHIMAVGTSDSHTVGDIVGQGRTYLRSSTDVPSKIDVDEACRAYREGLSSISHGLFTDVVVDGKHSMGSTLTVKGSELSVSFRVACAGWVRPERARVFLNGRLVANRRLDTKPGKPFDEKIEFKIPKPENDAHLICIATGPGVRGRFWRAQSTANYVLGATNPVFIDVDGDGKYTSPRHQALRILRKNGLDAERLVASLRKVDDAVAVQLLGEVHDSYRRLAGDDPKKQAEALAIVRSLVWQMKDRSVLAKFLKSIGG
jgi:hypothetical protein